MFEDELVAFSNTKIAYKIEEYKPKYNKNDLGFTLTLILLISIYLRITKNK